MKKPPVYSPDHQGRTLTHLGKTPVVVVGRTWVPLAELVGWIAFSRFSSKRSPARSAFTNLGMGAVHMLTTLGSEWCHNLAHVAAAQAINRPMDALRIAWGMPLCVYYELEDARVAPRQHLVRALGGPLFNLLAALGLHRVQAGLEPGTLRAEMVEVALGANLFIIGAGILPYPGLDGGVLLKWSLVDAGRSPQQADRIVRHVDGAVAAGLAGAAALQRRKRPWLSALLALLSLIGLGYALGFLREA